MSLAGTLVRNIASNWAGYAVHVAVAFFLTPYIVHSLGETYYGIWTLILGVTGYYGLLDLGVAAGMTQYLTRYRAANDIKKLNESASTGFAVLSGIGLLVFICSLIVAFSASRLFHIQAASPREVTVVLAVTGTSIAVQFGFFIYSAVFVAVQRFDLSNVIGISTRILSAAATVVCLKEGYGLIGLSLVMAGTNLLDYLIRWRVASRLLPALKISLGAVNRESCREVVSFGLWNFVSSTSVRLISYTDSLVIAAFMPVAAVAPFAIAVNLRSYFEDVFVRAGYVFFPAATELDARGDQQGLQRLYLISSKFMFLGAILCGSLAIFWARDFFRLWLGVTYAEPAAYPSVATLFSLLAIASIASIGQRIGYQVLLGKRQVDLLARLFLAEGLCNLFLSLLLVRRYGLIGVALGTLIPALVFQGLVQPIAVCRSLQISFRTYCTNVLFRPILVTVPIWATLFSLLPLEKPENWASLFMLFSISFVGALPVVFFIGFSRKERDLYLIRPSIEALRSFGLIASRQVKSTEVE